MIYNKLPKKFEPRAKIVSCYMEYGDKILLLLRHKSKYQGNRWGVPAGKIAKGENALRAMVREIKEETGQRVPPTQLEYLIKVYVKYPKFHFVYYMFRLKLDKLPRVSLSTKEHKRYKWVTPAKALQLELVRELDRCIKMFYV